MSAGALGRLHNDVTAIQVNRGISESLRDRELSALVHLHQRAIAQAQHGVSATGGTHLFAFG